VSARGSSNKIVIGDEYEKMYNNLRDYDCYAVHTNVATQRVFLTRYNVLVRQLMQQSLEQVKSMYDLTHKHIESICHSLNDDEIESLYSIYCQKLQMMNMYLHVLGVTPHECLWYPSIMYYEEKYMSGFHKFIGYYTSLFTMLNKLEKYDYYIKHCKDAKNEEFYQFEVCVGEKDDSFDMRGDDARQCNPFPEFVTLMPIEMRNVQLLVHDKQKMFSWKWYSHMLTCGYSVAMENIMDDSGVLDIVCDPGNYSILADQDSATSVVYKIQIKSEMILDKLSEIYRMHRKVIELYSTLKYMHNMLNMHGVLEPPLLVLSRV
jgi:hypothetical protein